MTEKEISIEDYHSLDGESISTIVRRLAMECPASNPGSLMNKLSRPMIRTSQPESRLSLLRNGKRVSLITHNIRPANLALIDPNPAWFPYPKDSVYCWLPGNITYLNMGLLNRNDSALWKPFIENSSGLIIDARQNADEMKGTNAIDIVLSMILPADKSFCRFSTVLPSFPGVFHLLPATSMGIPVASRPYRGKIAVLIDDNCISVGEFMTMAFRGAPGTVLVGSTTAGADGNVTQLWLPGGGLAQFTGLGVYNPDGSETQRVGLHPDVPAIVTTSDFLRRKDLALEKALLYLNNKR